MAGRAQKQERIDSLREAFEKSELIALINYEKITVEKINTIRRTLEKQGIGYKVEKNTLIELACKGTPREGLSKYLSGMTGVILSNEDPVETAKTLRGIVADFKGELFTIRGGYFDGDVLNSAQVEKVADLPGKGHILGLLQAPARDLLSLLKNYENKLAENAQ